MTGDMDDCFPGISFLSLVGGGRLYMWCAAACSCGNVRIALSALDVVVPIVCLLTLDEFFVCSFRLQVSALLASHPAGRR